MQPIAETPTPTLTPAASPAPDEAPFLPGIPSPWPPTAETHALYAELRHRPPAARPLAVGSDRRFVRPDLVVLLVAEAHATRFESPAAAVDLAALAVAVAAGLDAVDCDGTDRLADLKAEAAAVHANSLRVAGRPLDAEAAFRDAGRWLARGAGEPLLAARIDDLRASLAKDQQRFDQARELLDRAVAGYRRARLDGWVGRALVKLGSVLQFEGRYEEALQVLREASPLLRPESDRRTFVICAHNVVDCLYRTGYSIAARSLLADLRRLHTRLDDPINLLRLDWMEAEIDLELGSDERAERGLRRVRQGFYDLDLPYDAALVSLKLAEIYARRRDPFLMRRLAEEMLPIFQSRQIHREAVAALIVFREAVALHQASAGLIDQVSRFLREARRDRSLRFRPRL
jgi:tetratricopeptide (TPR) repeat protein